MWLKCDRDNGGVQGVTAKVPPDEDGGLVKNNLI